MYEEIARPVAWDDQVAFKDGDVTIDFFENTLEWMPVMYYLTVDEPDELPANGEYERLSEVSDIKYIYDEPFDATVTLSFDTENVDSESYELELFSFDEEEGTWQSLDNQNVDWDAGTVSGTVNPDTQVANWGMSVESAEDPPEGEGPPEEENPDGEDPPEEDPADEEAPSEDPSDEGDQTEEDPPPGNDEDEGGDDKDEATDDTTDDKDENNDEGADKDTEETVKETSDQSDKLPQTSTTMFTYLLIGLISLILGGSLYVYRRKVSLKK